MNTQIQWKPLFTRAGYPYFILDIAMNSFIREMNSYLGWSYADQLYIFKKGITQSFISTRDEKSFKEFISKLSTGEISRLLQEGVNIIQNVSHDLDSLWQKFGEVWQIPQSQIDVVNKVAQNYTKAYSVIRFPALLDLSSGLDFDSEIIQEASRVKEIYAQFYTKHESQLNSFLKKVTVRNHDDVSFYQLLTRSEIISLLEDEEAKFSDKQIQDRWEYSVMISCDSQIDNFDGDDAKEKIAEQIFIQDVDLGNVLQGSCARKGLVQGEVKVALSPSDLESIKSGTVVVTPMTTVTFTPYINSRVVAIVTDEGGITCHAAIIARELEIPCVTGTRVATQILKDGDLVEVDATNGIIKLIKK